MEVKYSSVVLFLLEKKCPIDSTRTWDHPLNHLARFGITAKPRFTRDEALPPQPLSLPTRTPLGLSVSQTRSFIRFIHTLRAQPETMKLRFIDQKGSAEETGRRVWRHWFRATIKHHLHHAIMRLYVFAGIHPVQLMYRSGETRMMRTCPDVLTYTTILGIDVFGPGVTYRGSDRTYCRDEAYAYLKSIVEIWWARSYETWNRADERDIPELRKSADEAIKSFVASDLPLRMEDIRLVQEKVNEYEKAALWHPQEALAVESYKSILEGIWSKAGKEIKRTAYPRAISLKKDSFNVGISIGALRGGLLPNDVEAEATWRLFVEYFADLKPVFESRPEWNDEMLQGLGGRG